MKENDKNNYKVGQQISYLKNSKTNIMKKFIFIDKLQRMDDLVGLLDRISYDEDGDIDIRVDATNIPEIHANFYTDSKLSDAVNELRKLNSRREELKTILLKEIKK